MTFKEYVETMVEYLEKHPEYAELPTIYAKDDDVNEYSEVLVGDPLPGIFDEYDVEYIFHQDDIADYIDEFPDAKINVICIN